MGTMHRTSPSHRLLLSHSLPTPIPLIEQLPSEVYGGLGILADQLGTSVAGYVELVLRHAPGADLTSAAPRDVPGTELNATELKELDHHVALAVQAKRSPLLNRRDIGYRWRQDWSE